MALNDSQEGLLPELLVLSMLCVMIRALLNNLTSATIGLLSLALLSEVFPVPLLGRRQNKVSTSTLSIEKQ